MNRREMFRRLSAGAALAVVPQTEVRPCPTVTFQPSQVLVSGFRWTQIGSGEEILEFNIVGPPPRLNTCISVNVPEHNVQFVGWVIHAESETQIYGGVIGRIVASTRKA